MRRHGYEIGVGKTNGQGWRTEAATAATNRRDSGLSVYRGSLMMAEWFNDWVTEHTDAFCLTDRDVTAMLAWRESFLSAGYTAAELRAATAVLLTEPERLNNDLRYQSKTTAHLFAIHA